MDNANQNPNTHNTTTNTAALPEPDTTVLEAAYARRLPEIMAMDAADGVRGLDVEQAVVTIRGAMPEINALRAEMAACTHVDQALVLGLEDYTWAADAANARVGALGAKAPAELGALYERAIELRDSLFAHASSLARGGVLPAMWIDGPKKSAGYKNTAADVKRCGLAILDRWTEAQGKTPLTEVELRAAVQVGIDLTNAAGAREQAPVKAAEVVEIRNRAVALMARAYDEVRRAVTYLRWHEGDAEEIAPSLFAGRGGRGRVASEVEVAGEVDGETDGGAGSSSAAPNGGANGNASPSVNPIPPGFPGASPFIS